MGGFDFDYWKNLAERDPVAYFEARERALRQFIASHPGQEAMLSELQVHIDSTRVLAGGPVQACRELLGHVEDQLMLLSFKLLELQREAIAMQKLVGSNTAVR
ncbi:MAG: DUF3135 domain-containing protein [Zoogloea sp.]|uniref:DUF3135 domain-containing protein n=1 Tax=Zoogloea sp. TaxID=49181 RepID=UPI002629D947|nr:DUF3135 domain-containing protein [Zoogloea sp.]MDD2988396.1 DUF3135 domain-containing protein [Zoogloea sp.]